MRTDTPVTIYRNQYVPYPYAIPQVGLLFDLEPARTKVTSTFRIERQPAAAAQAPLVLDGVGLTLESVTVDGESWIDRAQLTEATLTLAGLPAKATICIVGYCQPEANSTLMGLYVSSGNFFTQCEAEGFRRITWFADRPDVMSRYEVTLRAPTQYAQLLSNGNLVSTRELEDGRHEAVWQDPFPKPCYLFALVAGTFTCREMTATTRSGREVLLQVFSDPGSEDRTAWALESLHRALVWDEERFGLELDLDRFMIVAVHDFNMGAMENKGLNIFNAAYVLAAPETATDANYDGVEAVVGHEYFHNWTGNRVTCRDWFQLSLKEGLTVFRDQEFSADMMARGLPEQQAASARAVKRIDDVIRLRASQFAEDAGPMAHPIRPDSYQEIGNFYTATVYEKGAEIIRMQHTLLGEAGFRAGMDEYFRRHDGQAVTCDDFVNAMESVYTQRFPNRDLTQFRRWYSQAGTPRVHATLIHDAAQQRVTLTLTQHCDPQGVERAAAQRGELVKLPFHIPVAIGLLAQDGAALALEGGEGPLRDTVLLHLTESTQSWVFEGIKDRPVPSLLRNFSAPVIMSFDWSDDDLALLSSRDTNPFTRWEAGQELAARQIFNAMQQTGEIVLAPTFVDAWRSTLQAPDLDEAYRARALALPGVGVLAERLDQMDPPAVARAHHAVLAALGRALQPQWADWVSRTQIDQPYDPAPQQAGKRSLKNLAQQFLAAAGDPASDDRLNAQFSNANNMTDRFAALNLLVNFGNADIAAKALNAFYTQFKDDPLVVDKWFSLQARARTTTAADVQSLMAHPAFTLRNPNRARSLIFQFVLGNPDNAHNADGAGYALWRECVLKLDALNPEVAARLARAMDSWSRYTPALRSKMQEALQDVRNHSDLSPNVREIVSKALDLAG